MLNQPKVQQELHVKVNLCYGSILGHRILTKREIKVILMAVAFKNCKNKYGDFPTKESLP